ncbi:MAG TPA: hypothetical protein VGL48_15965 [Acidimicrobiales bacterium]|jgi:hypothetical protein
MRAGWFIRVAFPLAVVAIVGLGAVPADGAAQPTAKATKTVKLAQLGHGTFWECPSATTALLVGVNQLSLHPGQTLKVEFLAKNQGTSACNYVAPYAGAAPGPTSSLLSVGPCGSMGMEIVGAHHRDVWPGVQPFNCPALGFAQLQPGASVNGAGTWNQTTPNGTKRVKAGSYTLLIDGHFSFPLQIKSR